MIAGAPQNEVYPVRLEGTDCRWLLSLMPLSSTKVLTGLMGWPVSHSRSPALHNLWFEQTGINGAYVPLPVEPKGLADAVKGAAAMGFRGVNVTVPHKAAAAAIADRVDDSTRAIGAANTLSFAEGLVTASNTDWSGFLRNLDSQATHWETPKEPAVVLGAGGAARAVIWALLSRGITDIRVVNRSVDHARALELQFERDFQIHGWAGAARALDGAALLVNTTTLGMQDHPTLDITLGGLLPDAVVNDLVYAPMETSLLKAARQHGYHTVDGLGMLLHQASLSFLLWFGVEPTVDQTLRNTLPAAK